jgi:ribosomal-protein-alanine N-acetyltransferase
VKRTLLTFGPITPILRIFDIAKARAFYLDYLGCAVDFEHRFEPDLPLYMQVSRDDLVLHLSEHHGDGSPGVHIRIKVNDVRAFHAEITGKAYNILRPGIEQEWGEDSVNLTDPFGNRLTFSSLAVQVQKSVLAVGRRSVIAYRNWPCKVRRANIPRSKNTLACELRSTPPSVQTNSSVSPQKAP